MIFGRFKYNMKITDLKLRARFLALATFHTAAIEFSEEHMMDSYISDFLDDDDINQEVIEKFAYTVGCILNEIFFDLLD